jgi:chromosome segregation ATPase
MTESFLKIIEHLIEEIKSFEGITSELKAKLESLEELLKEEKRDINRIGQALNELRLEFSAKQGELTGVIKGIKIIIGVLFLLATIFPILMELL